MTFSTRIEKALKAAKKLSEVEWIEDKVFTHPDRPNYKTNEGRQIREELLAKCQERALEIIKHEPPFYETVHHSKK